MKKKLKSMEVDNKKILVRVDYNVTIIDGKIIDDTKIKSSLETIKYLLNHNCKIILLSHLGKVKTEEDKTINSLAPVAKKLYGSQIT